MPPESPPATSRSTPPAVDPPADTITVRVLDRRRVAERIDEFTFAALDSSSLPPWTPGSHIDVHAADGRIRQYSLINDGADTGDYRIAIDRNDGGRGGSTYFHRELIPGAEVRISLPRNHFALTRALGYVFVVGGIGITPALSLVAEAERIGRPWTLIYTAATTDRMAYADDLERRYGQRVRLHTSATSGRLDLAAELAGLAPGTAVYSCGPEALIADVEAACADQPAVDAFAERFVAVDRSDAADTSFEVSLALSGQTLQIPVGRSILDVLDDAGVVTVSSCREGICGTCEADVVSGEVEHRDSVLTPEERAENESMMICVSRCTSGRLVLDL